MEVGVVLWCFRVWSIELKGFRALGFRATYGLNFSCVSGCWVGTFRVSFVFWWV